MQFPVEEPHITLCEDHAANAGAWTEQRGQHICVEQPRVQNVESLGVHPLEEMAQWPQIARARNWKFNVQIDDGHIGRLERGPQLTVGAEGRQRRGEPRAIERLKKAQQLFFGAADSQSLDEVEDPDH